MLFTEPPLTPAKLARRLLKYNFWERRSLDPSVAANAIVASKQIARQPRVTTVLPTLQSLVEGQEDPKYLLNKMYTQPSVLKLVPDIWPTLLMSAPKPNLAQSLEILKGYCDEGGDPRKLENALFAIVRTEMGRGNFLECFKLLRFCQKQPLNWHFLGSVGCISIGILSGSVWISSWPITALLVVYWSGLAAAFAKQPAYPRVEWIPTVPLLYKQQHSMKIRIANQIVQGFEELGSVNVANYHYQQPNGHSTGLENELDILLRQYGFQRKQMPEADLYADYWSMDHHRWQQVEWKEPDQDPAMNPRHQ